MCLKISTVTSVQFSEGSDGANEFLLRDTKLNFHQVTTMSVYVGKVFLFKSLSWTDLLNCELFRGMMDKPNIGMHLCFHLNF